MDTLIDRLIILFFCISNAVFSIDTSPAVVIFLVSAVYSCFCIYLDDERSGLIPAAAGILCAFFYPPFVYILPVFSYDILRTKKLYRYIPLAAAAAVLYMYWRKAYSFEILLTEAAVCALAMFMAVKTQRHTALKREIVRLKDTSRELALLIEENKRNFIKQQDYEVHAAMLAERNRIARDIHDNVGHLLSRSLLMIGALQAQTGTNVQDQPDQRGANAQALAELRSTLSDAMDSIRASVHDLHDESIDLEDMLRKMTETFSFCPVIIDYDMKPTAPRDIKYCFLAVIREALSNTAKHSNASQVRVIVREHPALYQLLIEDSGVPGKTAVTAAGGSDGGRGIGLENMTERVKQLGGTISIGQTADGWRIFISILKTSIKEGNNDRTYR